MRRRVYQRASLPRAALAGPARQYVTRPLLGNLSVGTFQVGKLETAQDRICELCNLPPTYYRPLACSSAQPSEGWFAIHRSSGGRLAMIVFPALGRGVQVAMARTIGVLGNYDKRGYLGTSPPPPWSALRSSRGERCTEAARLPLRVFTVTVSLLIGAWAKVLVTIMLLFNHCDCAMLAKPRRLDVLCCQWAMASLDTGSM